MLGIILRNISISLAPSVGDKMVGAYTLAIASQSLCLVLTENNRLILNRSARCEWDLNRLYMQEVILYLCAVLGECKSP